jgi:hypothetical protein
MFMGEIPQGQRSKLLKNLRRRWLSYFQTDLVDVDWADAEHKLDLLRTPPPGAPRPDVAPGGMTHMSGPARLGTQPVAALRVDAPRTPP